MRKLFIALGALFLCLIGLSAERVEAQCSGAACVDSRDIVNGSIQTQDLAIGSVRSARIADQAVTEDKMADSSVQTRALMNVSVTEEKIADDAVTEDKIAVGAVRTRAIAPGAVQRGQVAVGAIQRSNIAVGAIGNDQVAAGAIQRRQVAANAIDSDNIMDDSLTEQDFSVANRVVVAKSGGDFTSIGEALASINPTFDNPFVIEVMPGTYVENIVMKSNVHLRGAGRGMVTITHNPDCGFCNVIEIIDVDNVEISGVTVSGAPRGASGILVQSAFLVTIRGNQIRGNGNSSFEGVTAFGIFIRNSSETKIIDNIIESNSCTGLATDFGGSSILHNFFGGQFNECDTERQDIEIVRGFPFISFNVVNGIGGSGARGQFNVTLDGDPIAVP